MKRKLLLSTRIKLNQGVDAGNLKLHKWFKVNIFQEESGIVVRFDRKVKYHQPIIELKDIKEIIVDDPTTFINKCEAVKQNENFAKWLKQNSVREKLHIKNNTVGTQKYSKDATPAQRISAFMLVQSYGYNPNIINPIARGYSCKDLKRAQQKLKKAVTITKENGETYTKIKLGTKEEAITFLNSRKDERNTKENKISTKPTGKAKG